ncbi:MAG TPA: hypothetical protein DCM67_12745 [Propionibacteriaceae bacterium]|nr:hypothetical protein [Propionibacteriaceae bacterium]
MGLAAGPRAILRGVDHPSLVECRAPAAPSDGSVSQLVSAQRARYGSEAGVHRGSRRGVYAEVHFGVRSVSTLRSQLRVVAKANSQSIWTPTPQVIPRVPNRDPYSDGEITQLLALVGLQTTERRRHILDVTLHVGLGLGLTAPEMLALRKTDIARNGSAVLANLPTRVVPARARYAAGIWRAAQRTSGARLLGDHLHPTRAFESLLRELQIQPYTPALKVRRLRTTWLVDVLSDGSLTIPEFWAIAGVRTGRVLDELAPYLPTRSDYLVRAVGP